MSNNIKYIAKYQKENTIQVNIRLSKKYDADVIGKLTSLDNTGKSTYIKRLIREDIAKSNGEVPAEVSEENSEQEETPSENEEDKSLTIAELAAAIGSSRVISGYPFAVSHLETVLSDTLSIPASCACVKLFLSRSSLITAPVTY